MEGLGSPILLVEDDDSLRLVARINLELEGFRVREAASVEAARLAVADERPLGVFLDVRLGGELSDDLLDELRASGIPVVLVSGTGDPAGYRDRVTEVVPKPFLPEQLVAAAKRLVVG
jgi:DNA-binding NtrC family response regulator